MAFRVCPYCAVIADQNRRCIDEMDAFVIVVEYRSMMPMVVPTQHGRLRGVVRTEALARLKNVAVHFSDTYMLMSCESDGHETIRVRPLRRVHDEQKITHNKPLRAAGAC